MDTRPDILKGKRGGKKLVKQAHGGAVARVEAHEWNEVMATKVRLGRSLGLSSEAISALVGLGKDTILKYYRHEYDNGLIAANMSMIGAIFSTGVGERGPCVTCDDKTRPKCEVCHGTGEVWIREPSPTAQIWWSKNMMGWSDQQRIEHTGAGGGPILTEHVSSADRVRGKLDQIAKRLSPPPANDKAA